MSGTVQVISSKDASQPLPRENKVFNLEPYQLMRVRDGKGARVRVLIGALWVTQDGDLRDTVLEAGEEFVLDRNGIAVLHPLGTESVQLALGQTQAQGGHAHHGAALATA